MTRFLIIIILLVLNIFQIILSDCGSELLQNQSDTNPYPLDSAISKGSIKNCGCNPENVCIRKCCGLNYNLDNQTCVFGNSSKIKDLAVYKNADIIKSNNIRLIPGMMIKCFENQTFMSLVPDQNSELTGYIQGDGKLWISSYNIFFNQDNYCLDYSENFGLIYNTCFENSSTDLDVSDHITLIGVMISLPFFLVTFLVYALLPERNLHAKCLMCHVFAIFMAYLLLTCVFIIREDLTDMVTCRAILMIALCCFLSSIFWVNIMAFNICQTFSGSGGHSPNKKQEERRRFIIYNIYAWGIPLLFISLIVILSNTVKPNVWYDPGVREQRCSITEGLPMLLYYYGPLAILVISNIVMFIITACKIKKAQKDTAMLTSRGSQKHGAKDNDKQMFQLFIKLLFAMGVNWSMEIIPWAVNWQFSNVPPAVWYLTDFFNAAYGVIVFIVFVCKKNIWRALKKRFYKARGTTAESETTATTNSLMT